MKRIFQLTLIGIVLGGLVGCSILNKNKPVVLVCETIFELPVEGENVSIPCDVSLALSHDGTYISKMVMEEKYNLSGVSQETINELTTTQDKMIRDVYKDMKGFTYGSKYENGIMNTSLTVNMNEVDLNNEDSKDYLEMLFKFAPDKYEDGKYPLDDCVNSHLESEYEKSEG